MEKLKHSKTIAGASTALLLISLLWIANINRTSNSLRNDWEKEKLNGEILLSEKLFAEKEVQKFKEQVLQLKDKNRDLDDVARNYASKLEQQATDFNRIKKENASLAQLKKERAELVSKLSQSQNELQSLRSSHEELQTKGNEMETMLAQLQDRNRLLTEDLQRAMFAAVDQSLVLAVKGRNERLTIKANRTKKLIANFEVPTNYKNLSYRIIDVNGNVFTSKDGAIVSTAAPSKNNYIASSDIGFEGNKLQKVEMIYTPKEKLKTGVYRVEISNESLYVGSLNVRLK